MESERDAPVVDDQPCDPQGPLSQLTQVPTEFALIAMHQEIYNTDVHTQLQNDHVEYLSAIKGNTH
jgi:hypothetical protein